MDERYALGGDDMKATPLAMLRTGIFMAVLTVVYIFLAICLSLLSTPVLLALILLWLVLGGTAFVLFRLLT